MVDGAVSGKGFSRALKLAAFYAACVYAVCIVAAYFVNGWLNGFLAGSGFTLLYSRPEDVFFLPFKMGLKLALLAGAFALAVYLPTKLFAKRPGVIRAALYAPAAGLAAGYATGVPVAFSSFVSMMDRAGAGHTVTVGSFYSFVVNAVFFTGACAMVVAACFALFATSKSRYRALYLVPALADAMFYSITAFPF